MSEIKYLTLQNISDINKKIHMEALKDKNGMYGANSDDEIDKIEKLVTTHL